MNKEADLTQNELKDRLNSIIGYLRQKDPVRYNNQTNISKVLNIQRTNLSAALNGDSRYLKKDSPVVQAIFLNFPEISKEWFVSGNGKMIDEPQDQNSDSINHNIKKVSVKEFEKLPIARQLSLIWEALLQRDQYFNNKISFQDDQIVKILDYIEETVAPMYEYIKLKENKKSL